MLDIRTDILPLTDFKRRTNEFVERLRSTHRPLVLTINGKPEIVVLNAAAYQEMQDRLSAAEQQPTGRSLTGGKQR